MLTKEIFSLQHPIVKTFVKLRKERKFRYRQKQVVIMGDVEVTEAKNLDILLIAKGVKCRLDAKESYLVPLSILKKVTGLKQPQGLAATVEMPKMASLENYQWIVALDGVADPGNLGTLLRTALALGWEGVFLTPRSADPYGDKALRAGKGAAFQIPIRLGSPEDLTTYAEKKGLPLWIADPRGQPFQPHLTGGILILGNETSGACEEIKKRGELIQIPIKNIESLNVASAGAILMHGLRGFRR